MPVAAPSDAELAAERERFDDAVRSEMVARAAQAAEKAPEGKAGERERQAARAIIEPYLDRACADQEAVIDERYRRARGNAPDFEAALAQESDPAKRDRLYQEWSALEHSLESVRTARHEAREVAARAVGSRTAFELAAHAEPCDPSALAEDIERGAMRSLDDAIGRASRNALGAVALSGSSRPRWQHLVEFDACLDRAAIAPILRELGGALGEDPDTHGPQLIRGRAAWDTTVIPPGERAAVVTGTSGGPGGLRAALRAFGSAAHGGAMGRRRGAAAAVVVDPAFDRAATILFGRLLRSGPFRAWAGVREAASLAAAIVLVEAVETRSAWMKLRAAARDLPTADAGALDRERENLRQGSSYETAGAAELRGAIFAVLLEESLMTRHGRSWFLDRDAGIRLAEMWEAEPDETAESMAGALSLGKMDADVLLEGFRP